MPHTLAEPRVGEESDLAWARTDDRRHGLARDLAPYRSTGTEDGQDQG